MMRRANMPMQYYSNGGDVSVFESRATDPRKPSTIPLQERMARQGLDDNLEGILLEYVKGDLSQDEYLRDLEAQIANAKKYGFPESAVQYVIDRNTDANLDFLDYAQFYADDVFTGDRVAREAAIYQGKVPFGAEGDSGLYHTINPGGIYNTRAFLRRKMGDPDQIYFSGKSSTSPIVYHEGYHSTNTPLYKYVDEEKGVRGLDYYRGLATGDKKLMEQSLSFFDDPSRENIRTAAVSTVLGVDDKNLSDYNNLEMETLSDYYESTLDKEGVSGIAETLGGLVGLSVSDLASENRPNFQDIIKNATDEEFIEFLKVAPAYETQASSLINPKPRSVVRGYELGGEVDGYPATAFTQQSDRRYSDIFPVSRPVGEHPIYGELPVEFDPAGGFVGKIGRGIETFEQYLSGAPISDQQLVSAGLDVIPTTSGVASMAGPAAAPGILGSFYFKHGSPRRFSSIDVNAPKNTNPNDPTSGAYGPGFYGAFETEDTIIYALKNAERAPVNENDMSFNVGLGAETTNDALTEASKKAASSMFTDKGRIYFMPDGSSIVHNGKTGQIERLGKGTGYVYSVLMDANKDELFDMSKRMAEQPKAVQDAVSDMSRMLNVGPADTGKTFWTALRNSYGTGPEAELKANEFLKNRGIPGALFKDRGTKDALVVFDTDLLELGNAQAVSKVPAKKFANGGGVGTLSSVAREMFRR